MTEKISRTNPSSSGVSLLPTQHSHRRLNPLTGAWVKVFEDRVEGPPPSAHNVAEAEELFQRRHLKARGVNLLTSYTALELRRGERIVFENRSWVALVPFWASHPFEVMVLPRRHVVRIAHLTEMERDALHKALKWLKSRYEVVFGVAFPECVDWHEALDNAVDTDHWQLHAHLCPTAADLGWAATPEQAAGRLRGDDQLKARATGV